MPNGPKIGNLEKIVTEEILAPAWVEPDKAFTNRFKMAVGGASATRSMIRNERSAAEAIETGPHRPATWPWRSRPPRWCSCPPTWACSTRRSRASGSRCCASRSRPLEEGDAAIDHKVKLTLADGQELHWTIHKLCHT